jgi:ParB-like chromosome segregation protein Spo0J
MTEPARRQGLSVDHDAVSRSTGVDRWLEMLRQAIEDAGWKHDALAAALGVDKAYLSRMLTGEKPWRIEHLVGLPDDIERLFERRRAEQFGLIVVELPADELTARRQLVSGLLGVLAPRLPAKADQMAKAYVKPHAAKATR